MEISKLSGQQVNAAGLQTEMAETEVSHQQIGRMRDQAMDSPEEREGILKALEQYEEKHRGTKLANAAGRAVSTILAVQMLEALQAE